MSKASSFLSQFFCKHTWGEINDHGYQTCKNCGKVHYAGFSECIHEWDVHDTLDGKSMWSAVLIRIYIMRCKKCGEMKNFKSNS